MKIRLTIITENDKSISVLGENPEVKIKQAWDLVLTLIATLNPGDKAFVEKVEVIEENDDHNNSSCVI